MCWPPYSRIGSFAQLLQLLERAGVALAVHGGGVREWMTDGLFARGGECVEVDPMMVEEVVSAREG